MKNYYTWHSLCKNSQHCYCKSYDEIWKIKFMNLLNGHHQNIDGTKWFCKMTLETALIMKHLLIKTLPVHINKFTNRFDWLTIINEIRNRFTTGITNDRITCITRIDRFSNVKYFDKLANTADVIDITFSHIIGTDRLTNSWGFDELTKTTDLTDNVCSCIIGTKTFTNT